MSDSCSYPEIWLLSFTLPDFFLPISTHYSTKNNTITEKTPLIPNKKGKDGNKDENFLKVGIAEGEGEE